MRTIIVLCCCFPLLALSQKRKTFRTSLNEMRSTWNYAYFGERGTHPGVRVSYDYPFLANKITKEKQFRGERSKTRSFQRVYQVSGNVATFYHPKNTTGLLTFASLERQKGKGRGWTRTLGLSLGYIHTFRNGVTYRTKEDGTFEEIIGQQGGTLLGLQVGLIRNQVNLGKANFNWYAKANIFIQAPFNTALTFRDFWELGVSLPVRKKTTQDNSR
ncbi:MAG: hypothetical protein AAF806_03705 [Bacteroidota bacterium]